MGSKVKGRKVPVNQVPADEQGLIRRKVNTLLFEVWVEPTTFWNEERGVELTNGMARVKAKPKPGTKVLFVLTFPLVLLGVGIFAMVQGIAEFLQSLKRLGDSWEVFQYRSTMEAGQLFEEVELKDEEKGEM